MLEALLTRLDEFRVVVDGLGPDVDWGYRILGLPQKILDQELAVNGLCMF